MGADPDEDIPIGLQGFLAAISKCEAIERERHPYWLLDMDADMSQSLIDTLEDGNERMRLFCQMDKDKMAFPENDTLALTKGECVGDNDSCSRSSHCPPNWHSIGNFHTHPAGSRPHPSLADIQTMMRRKEKLLCIAAHAGTVCYIPNDTPASRSAAKIMSKFRRALQGRVKYALADALDQIILAMDIIARPDQYIATAGCVPVLPKYAKAVRKDAKDLVPKNDRYADLASVRRVQSLCDFLKDKDAKEYGDRQDCLLHATLRAFGGPHEEGVKRWMKWFEKDIDKPVEEIKGGN